ncbi:hypothetical protein Tco_1119723 [Tanacetum coccineum]
MVGEMHKETHQAYGGPTSLEATSEEGAYPQLSSGMSEFNLIFSIFHFHSECASESDGMDKGTQNYSLDHKLIGTNSSVLVDKTKSARDGLKTAHTDSDDSEEEEIEKHEDTHTTSHDVHSLQSQKEKLDQQKAKAEAEVSSLKARPSYLNINQLTELLITSLKHELSKLLSSHDFASCLSTELKELSLKFTKLSGDIKKQMKHEKLNTVVENASGVARNNVPLADKAIASPTKGEKNTNPSTTDAKPNLHDELKSSKIINYDVLTQKGPILLNVYMEDKTIEVISNFKVSDLHLAEWREVVQACPDRKEKGWKTIYGLLKTRMKYLDQTKKELNIDFNKPFKEQDTLNELNNLANKKKKRIGDLKDHSRSTKKHKSSVQHEKEVQ